MGHTYPVTYFDVGYDILFIVTLQIRKQCRMFADIKHKTTTYSSTWYSLMSVLRKSSVMIHDHRTILCPRDNCGPFQLQRADLISKDYCNLVPSRILLLHTNTRKQTR